MQTPLQKIENAAIYKNSLTGATTEQWQRQLKN